MGAVPRERLGYGLVLALRRTINRGVRHPVFGPLCLILLALLVVFTVIHGAHDQIHEGKLIVCVSFLISAIVSLVLPRLPLIRLVAVRSSRAPPFVLFDTSAPPGRLFGPAPAPLRL